MPNGHGPSWGWIAAGFGSILATIGGWWTKTLHYKLSELSDRASKTEERLGRLEQLVKDMSSWVKDTSRKLDRFIERHLDDKD